MNRIATGVVVAAAFSLATVSAVPARGQGSTASVEDQIKKMEKDRAAAVVKGDVATLEKLTSDDYILINANGELSDKPTTMNNIKTGVIKSRFRATAGRTACRAPPARTVRCVARDRCVSRGQEGPPPT